MRRSLGIISGAFALRSQPFALVGRVVFWRFLRFGTCREEATAVGG
jgi:hypothetical protein